MWPVDVAIVLRKAIVQTVVRWILSRRLIWSLELLGCLIGKICHERSIVKGLIYWYMNEGMLRHAQMCLLLIVVVILELIKGVCIKLDLLSGCP